MSDSSIQDIFDACNLILSPVDRTPTLDFVRHLQLPALKTAYRKKALETHPDRSKVIGKIESELNKNILIERSWEKGYNLKFADYALKRGYITSFEHMALLGKQKCLQRPIGEYFIGKKILSPQELNRILQKLTIHNRNTIWTCRSGQKKRKREKENL